MCKWGTDVVMPLEIPVDCSHTGQAYIKNVGVDACLAPIVKALNDAGVKTVACCCGHGKSLGSIHLADKRVLLIYPDRASAERAFDAFESHAVGDGAAIRKDVVRVPLTAGSPAPQQPACPCESFPCVHTTRPHKRL